MGYLNNTGPLPPPKELLEHQAAILNMAKSAVQSPQHMSVTPFPITGYRSNNFYSAADDVFALLFTISFMGPSFWLIRALVAEKEERIREGMKMMVRWCLAAWITRPCPWTAHLTPTHTHTGHDGLAPVRCLVHYLWSRVLYHCHGRHDYLRPGHLCQLQLLPRLPHVLPLWPCLHLLLLLHLRLLLALQDCRRPGHHPLPRRFLPLLFRL